MSSNHEIWQSAVYNGTRIEVVLGDIATFPIEAIVNEANTRLRNSGAIHEQIHRAAGATLHNELVQLYPDGGQVGQAYLSGAHNIRTARHIIHAIGPDYNQVGVHLSQQRAEELLTAAYQDSLNRAVEVSVRSVAFPTNSTGENAFPNSLASNTAMIAVTNWLDDVGAGFIDRIAFVMDPAGEDFGYYFDSFSK
jgi:O-acetyl-ADP-ribose deacetylase